MARLRPGRVAEVEMSFHQPGRYFMYCTVFCGPAHDVMQAVIEVV
jgi:cytochrome c oxidase subunit 2